MRVFDAVGEGFGVSSRLASTTPILAAILAVPGSIVFASPIDWRTSVVPWLFAAIPACLAVTCLGLIRIHDDRWVTASAGWAALALLGIGGFFLAVGIGGLTGLQDLPEDELGLLAWLPVVAFGFGFLSLTPALLATAFSTRRAGRIPRWGVWALWFLSPLLLITFAIGGNGPAPFDEMAAPAGLTLILIGWIVVGLSLLRASVPVSTHE